MSTTTTAGTRRGRDVDVADAVPRVRPLRILFVAALAVLVISAGHFIVTKPELQWSVVGEYFFSPDVLKGIGISLLLTAAVMVAGVVMGILLAAASMSDFSALRVACQWYIDVLRAIPALLLLIFWFNIAYLFPTISLGIPFGPEWLSVSTNDIVSPFVAAFIAMSLHESAYMAEIIRGGLNSVDSGQRDAARAQGFSAAQTFRAVILPQALRVIVPPTGNQIILTLKGTSLVSVIGLTDLLGSVQRVYQTTYQVVPLLLVAAIWYIILVLGLSALQKQLEARAGRGWKAQSPIAAKRKGANRG